MLLETGFDHARNDAQENARKTPGSTLFDPSLPGPVKDAETAKQVADTVAAEAGTDAGQAKDAAAAVVKGAASALRTAADEMRTGSPQERTFSQIAEGLADASDAMRDTDLGEMVGAVSDFARRNPMVFLASAAFAGFAATRFAKASRPERAAERTDRAPHGQPAQQEICGPLPGPPCHPDRGRNIAGCALCIDLNQHQGRRYEMSTESNKTAGGLVGDALSHVSALVRSEVDLARAEVNENLKSAGVAIGLIIGGIVVVLTALNVLVAALVAALTKAGMSGGWAALIVGVALAVIAYVMMNKGTNDLKLSSLAPTRTARNVKRDAQAVKEVCDDT